MTLSVYKHDTFTRDCLGELRFTGGPRPGVIAPDFDLPTTRQGGRFRLSSRRGRRPVVLTFGAITCPHALAATEALRDLHDVFEGRADMVTVYVREMHPGELRPQPRLLHTKMRYAREWVELDRISWTVAVDRLDGETHALYGLLPAAAYVIDSSGRVAFRCVWSGEKRALRRALEAVLDAEGRGLEAPVLSEKERSPLCFVQAAIELKRALGRGGTRAREEYRDAVGRTAASVQRFVSGLEGLFTPVRRKAG